MAVVRTTNGATTGCCFAALGSARAAAQEVVWANLGDDVPDGICVDADGAVWYADVPNTRCVRVREGGEVLQTVDLDRGCFALHEAPAPHAGRP